MLAAALIPYAPEERNFTLQNLLEHLTAKLGLTLTDSFAYDNVNNQWLVEAGEASWRI